MERFNANVGSLDTTLQQAPIVFESVSVNVLYGVGFGVVNDVMNVLGVQIVVPNPSVTENLRASRNISKTLPRRVWRVRSATTEVRTFPPRFRIPRTATLSR